MHECESDLLPEWAREITSADVPSIPIGVKYTAPDVPVPVKATEGSAGYDLRVYIPVKDAREEPRCLYPGETLMFGTGLMFEIPRGFAGIVTPRSGLGGKKGLVLGNLVGVIDSDYRGEVKIPLWNRSKEYITVTHGMSVAQILFMPCPETHLVQLETLSETARGANGFGHSGV